MPVHQESGDDALVRYLLDELDDEDTERFDELSVVDEGFVARLRAVENDLVDAYASGTLTCDRRQRFEALYLSSPRRRAKAAFAARLHDAIDSAAVAAAPGQKPAERRRLGSQWFPAALAAAAVLCVAMLALLLRDAQLRGSLREADGRLTAAEGRIAGLSSRLATEQKADADTAAALARVRAAESAMALAFVLLPQTRSAGPVPIVAIGPDAATLPLALTIQSPARGEYQAVLHDPATNREVWRSQPAAAEATQGSSLVTIAIPAPLLNSQHYVVDVFAFESGRGRGFVGSYAFEAVRR
jgi:hypothetical protein